MHRSLVFAISFLTLVGCGTVLESPVSLDETSWSLPLPKGEGCDALPYLEFSGKRVTGDLGCNRISGEYRVDGNRITFHNLALTKKSCDPKTMAVEHTMLKAIEQSKKLRQSGDTLCFLDAQGGVLMEMVPETLGACH